MVEVPVDVLGVGVPVLDGRCIGPVRNIVEYTRELCSPSLSRFAIMYIRLEVSGFRLCCATFTDGILGRHSLFVYCCYKD
jgi:hypothetical protein